MAFANRLKEARLAQGFTQEQLAEKIGVAKTTYTGYEKGNREPNVHTIAKLMEALDVDANFLWQDEADFSIELFPTEKELIKKYRALDERGKNLVDSILEEAYSSRPTDCEGQLTLIPIDGYYKIYHNGKWENYKKCEEMYDSNMDFSDDSEMKVDVVKAAHNDSNDPAEIEKMMQDLENLKRPE